MYLLCSPRQVRMKAQTKLYQLWRLTRASSSGSGVSSIASARKTTGSVRTNGVDVTIVGAGSTFIHVWRSYKYTINVRKIMTIVSTLKTINKRCIGVTVLPNGIVCFYFPSSYRYLWNLFSWLISSRSRWFCTIVMQSLCNFKLIASKSHFAIALGGHHL